MIGGAGIWTPGCTVIGGQQNLTQLIKSLFSNNEVGFAYDPNDLTTLYRDEAGIIPVTAAGQPVGLVLDKSEGLVLGSESIVNGTFESGLQYATKFDGNGSASTWTLNTNQPISGIQDGLLTVTAAGTDRPGISFTRKEGSVVGAVYELSFDYSVKSGPIILSRVYTGSGTVLLDKNLSGKGKFSIKFRSTGVAFEDVVYFSRSLGVVQIDNFSVKRVLGNHAYQTTSAQRPLLVANPQRLDYDTADDKLITNLPAQLTGCTVIRAVPNVGTQILTGQTIPATYEDNKDHCGLIVINRALTTTETNQITKLFNKAAGV